MVSHRAFIVAFVLRLASCEECQNCGEPVSLLQSRSHEGSRASKGQSIVVKGPSKSSGSPAEQLAPTCAAGFNAAYEKCLGGKNGYLMIIVADEKDAYCAYTGGWAQTSEYYPDPSACFASPGQSEALFYDATSLSLATWSKETAVAGPLKQDYTALSCSGSGAEPCSATPSKYGRTLTKGGKTWQVVPPGGEFSFDWSPSDGYVNIETKTPQKIYLVSVKNNLGPSSSSGLSNDIPCGGDGSVDFQAKTFPINGLGSGCQKDNDDYWMAFGSGTVTVCFPDVPC
ncbi:Pol [Symbiodinium sp. CCMP2592]|nr:Pol [Symbiodinium sp. CCMP2592]